MKKILIKNNILYAFENSYSRNEVEIKCAFDSGHSCTTNCASFEYNEAGNFLWCKRNGEDNSFKIGQDARR